MQELERKKQELDRTTARQNKQEIERERLRSSDRKYKM